MSGTDRGFRVVIDLDTGRVRSTTATLVPESLFGGGPGRARAAMTEPVMDRKATPAAITSSPAPPKGSSELYVWRDARGTLNITSFPPLEGGTGLQ